MADLYKNFTSIAIKSEAQEGEYVAPAAGADFVEAMIDGNNINKSREVIERGVVTNSITKSTPRLGAYEVSGELQVEMKANGVEGAAPEFGLLLESVLGGKRSKATVNTTTDNTVGLLKVAATAGFNVGDIVLVKDAGKYHLSPIKAIVTDTSLELEIAMAEAPANGCAIAAYQSYVGANSGHANFSVTKYMNDALAEKAWGCKVNSLSLNDFTPNGIAKFAFGYEGMGYARELEANAITPAFDSALSPIIVSACVYYKGVKIDVSELGLNVENVLAWKRTTCANTGKKGSNITARNISGSFTTFKDSLVDNIFADFDSETEFSLFVNAYVPTSTAGQFKDVVGIWLPKCRLTELSDSDADGMLQDQFSFSAHKDSNGNDIVITFI